MLILFERKRAWSFWNMLYMLLFILDIVVPRGVEVLIVPRGIGLYGSGEVGSEFTFPVFPLDFYFGLFEVVVFVVVEVED